MTLPPTVIHALNEQAARLPEGPALWAKAAGVYQALSWRDYAHHVRAFALSLLQDGFPPGARLAVLGLDRPQSFIAHLAAIAVGGVCVVIPPVARAQDLVELLAHVGAGVLVAENDALAELSSFTAAAPRPLRVVGFGRLESLPRGALAFDERVQSGSSASDGPYWERLNGVLPGSLAVASLRLSGKANSREVKLSHRNLTWTAATLSSALELSEGDSVLAQSPLTVVSEQLICLYASLMSGMQVYFAEPVDRVVDTLKQARPTIFFAAPQIWRGLEDDLNAGLLALPESVRRLAPWARKSAALRTHRVMAQERIPSSIELPYQLAAKMILDPAKRRLGLDRARLFLSLGAGMTTELLERFASMDIPIHELYGQAETSGLTSLSETDRMKFGTVGRPVLGVHVRISERGEIQVRGENVCLKGATASNRWLRTGDLGELDSEGFLRVTGRIRS